MNMDFWITTALPVSSFISAADSILHCIASNKKLVNETTSNKTSAYIWTLLNFRHYHHISFHLFLLFFFFIFSKV